MARSALFPAVALGALVLSGLACIDSPPPTVRPTEYQAQDLSGLSFANKNLSGADFSNKTLYGVDFSGADLRQADFSGARLSDSDFRHSLIAGTNFSNAEMFDVKLEQLCGFGEAKWTGAQLDAKWETVRQLYQSGREATLPRPLPSLSAVCWKDIDLSGVDFGGGSLTESVFTGTVRLEDASFAGADLTRVSLAGLSVSTADFTGAITFGMDVRHANLEDAVITDAQLNVAVLGCTRMPGGGIYRIEDCGEAMPPD